MHRKTYRILALSLALVSVVGLSACKKTTSTNSANSANANVKPNPGIILGISPNKGSASGGTAITLTGNNFLGSPKVLFGTAEAKDVKVVNDKQITVTSPAGMKGTKVDITLKASDGPTSTLQAGFTYE